MKKTFQQMLDSDGSVSVRFKPKTFEIIKVGARNVDDVIQWVDDRGGKAVKKSGVKENGFTWAGVGVTGSLTKTELIIERGDFIRYDEASKLFTKMTFLEVTVDCEPVSD